MERYDPERKYLVMTRDEVRAFDSWAINQLGVPGVVLMENAGRSCAELIKEKLKGAASPKVCIFCGTGNNGGDGYVIARHLFNSGIDVVVVICGDSNKVKGDAKINLDILRGLSLPIEQLNFDEDMSASVAAFCADADMVVDAIFGTGLRGRLSEDYKRLIDDINVQNRVVLAVDIPSGLDCDTGQSLGAVIEADYTVTFAALKAGFTLPAASVYTGKVFIASIGVEPSQRRPC